MSTKFIEIDGLSGSQLVSPSHNIYQHSSHMPSFLLNYLVDYTAKQLLLYFCRVFYFFNITAGHILFSSVNFFSNLAIPCYSFAYLRQLSSLFSFNSRFEKVREAQIKREFKVKFILVATYIFKTEEVKV